MNWLLVANTVLTFCAGIWYIGSGQTILGLLQLTFTISNILFLVMGAKP